MRRSLLPCIWFATFSIALGAENENVDLGSIGRSALEKVRPFMVRIETTSAGSAIARTQSGLRISAGEVITTLWRLDPEPAAIVAELADGARQPASMVGRDDRRGIALLKLAGTSTLDKTRPIPSAVPRQEIRVGQWAWSVGSIWPDAPSLSIGMVSATGRVWGEAIQTDAKVSPINYGGPLIDRNGNVLGIIVPLDPVSKAGTISTSIYDSGVGFAIPLDAINESLPRLRQGNIAKGLSGLSFAGTDELLGPPIIGLVAWRSPAAAQGILPGDIITRVDRSPITRRAEFLHALGSKSAGAVLSLSLRRGSKELETKLTLADSIPTFRWPTTGLLWVEKGNTLEVIGTLPGSSASKANIGAGDALLRADGQSVTNRNEFEKILDQRAIGEKITLEIRAATQSRSVPLTISEGMTAIPNELANSESPDRNLAAELSDRKHRDVDYWIRLPAGKKGDMAGLIYFLDGASPVRQNSLLKAWEGAADRHQLILAGVSPLKRDRWELADIDRATSILDYLLETESIDRRRVVLHGAYGSVGIALQVTVARRAEVRGLVIVGPTPLPFPPMNPTEKLALVIIEPSANPSTGKGRLAWESAGYPVIRSSINVGTYLVPEEIERLGRWSSLLGMLH